MLKKFKGKEGFIENVGLSRFKIYIITLHNLRNNFRLIKMVCGSNEGRFL